MKIRHVLAGTVAAALLSVGTVGVAYADTTAPSAPTTSTVIRGSARARCDKLRDLLPKLEDRRVRSERRIDGLNKAIARARAHHREDLAQALEHRRDKVQRYHDRVVDHINKIHERCDR